jgi:hypothetical protein
LVRGGHRGIHPGANVALDLLIWLGFLGAVIVFALVGAAARAVSSVDDDQDVGDFNRGTVFDKREFGDYLWSDIGGTTAKAQAIMGLGATVM